MDLDVVVNPGFKPLKDFDPLKFIGRGIELLHRECAGGTVQLSASHFTCSACQDTIQFYKSSEIRAALRRLILDRKEIESAYLFTFYLPAGKA